RTRYVDRVRQGDAMVDMEMPQIREPFAKQIAEGVGVRAGLIGRLGIEFAPGVTPTATLQQDPMPLHLEIDDAEVLVEEDDVELMVTRRTGERDVGEDQPGVVEAVTEGFDDPSFSLVVERGEDEV